MQYQITSDNIDMSPSMEVLTKEKFERIEHRFRDIPEGSKSARIVLNSSPDNTFTVKAELVINGKEYFSDETDFTLEGALIKTVEELVRMTEKEKDKRERREGAKGVVTTEDLLDTGIEE
jgi:ribosomal subunit interface protein